MSEQFELTLCSTNMFVEADVLQKLSERFNTVYPQSGLPLQIRVTHFPVPIHIDTVFEADCTQDEKKDIIKCWREGFYCAAQFSSIAKTMRKIEKIEANTTFIAVFVCKQASMKDSHGDCDFDEETGNWIITVGFQRLDAVISTIFHELFEIFFYNEKVDVHCNDTNCFMNIESASLTLCDSCSIKVQQKLKK